MQMEKFRCDTEETNFISFSILMPVSQAAGDILMKLELYSL